MPQRTIHHLTPQESLACVQHAWVATTPTCVLMCRDLRTFVITGAGCKHVLNIASPALCFAMLPTGNMLVAVKGGVLLLYEKKEKRHVGHTYGELPAGSGGPAVGMPRWM